MTIKEASEASGISIDNLRYYERIGLIPKIPRNSSGMREYDETALRLIDFVMRFKKCGMKLEKIREYMRLAMQGEETRARRREILIEARNELQAQLSNTQRSIDIINYKIDNYETECVPCTESMIRDWKEKENNDKGRDC